MLYRSGAFICFLIASTNGDQTVDEDGAVDDQALIADGAAADACNDFLFSIRTDEFPEDTKYSLTNSKGEAIWEESPWGFEDQGKKFEHEACLPVDECYTFIIFDNDEFRDGCV